MRCGCRGARAAGAWAGAVRVTSSAPYPRPCVSFSCAHIPHGHGGGTRGFRIVGTILVRITTRCVNAQSPYDKSIGYTIGQLNSISTNRVDLFTFVLVHVGVRRFGMWNPIINNTNGTRCDYTPAPQSGMGSEALLIAPCAPCQGVHPWPAQSAAMQRRAPRSSAGWASRS